MSNHIPVLVSLYLPKSARMICLIAISIHNTLIGVYCLTAIASQEHASVVRRLIANQFSQSLVLTRDSLSVAFEPYAASCRFPFACPRHDGANWRRPSSGSQRDIDIIARH